MNKRFIILVWVICTVCLLRFGTGLAPAAPGLNLVKNGSQVTLSWTNLSSSIPYINLYGFMEIQSATNLSRPVNWQEFYFAGSTGQISMAAAGRQEFFRPVLILPLFQYAIFYNLDLEINPGAAMTINGRVHSNGNIWATGTSSSSPLTFSTLVDAVGTISNLASPLDPQNIARSGNVIYDGANNPFPSSQYFSTLVGGQPTNFLATLQMPPTAYSPPNYTAAYSTTGSAYLKNDVDLIVSNTATGTNGTFGTNIIVYYQNPNDTLNPLQAVPPDLLVTNVIGLNTVVNYTYSFVTNVSFYDYREGQTAQAVQIDVNLLNIWLTNTAPRGGSTYNVDNLVGAYSKGHFINSIYVYNSVALTSSQLPTVRLVNGTKLPPAGFTVVTPQPIYVKGNYNTTINGTTFSTALGDTTNTVPASILGDAVTLLSSNWLDIYNSSTPLPTRVPANIVVNTAMLEGIVPSNGTHYSGGVENFLRLEENWGSSYPVTYNGSIVVMYPSQYATNFWVAPGTTGAYYSAPVRAWGFDSNFSNPNKLPPLTPTVGNFETP